MQQIGYSLVNTQGAETQFWGDIPGQTEAVPNRLVLPSGDHVLCPQVGVAYQGLTLWPRWLDVGAPSITFDGTKVTVLRPAVVPQSITRKQYYQQCTVLGWMTPAQVTALFSVGTLPPSVVTFIGNLPAAQQFAATLFILEQPIYSRQDPMLLSMWAAGGLSAAAVDAFFIAAALL